MTEEFNLSDKEITGWEGGGILRDKPSMFHGKDVKEFIIRLKESKEIDGLDLEYAPHKKRFLEIIDKLAGEKLI